MRVGLTLRMVVASGLLALIVGGAFAMLFVAIEDLRESGRLARHSREELAAADRLEKLVIDLETGQRGFVITRQERFLEPWNAARRAFPERAARLQRFVDSPEQGQRAQRIAEAGMSYIREHSVPLVEAARRNDPSAASVAATEEGKRRIDALRAEFDRFTATEREILTARQEAADAAARRAIVAATAGLAGSVLLIALFAGYLTRAIVQPVRRVAAMAGRLAGGDLATRLPETSAAEIGALERAFNTMGRSLEESRDELARLVAEQTALRRVATLVARGVSPTEVFDAVVAEAGRLLGADSTRLLRYEEDEAATVVAGWSEQAQAIPVGTRLTLEGDNIAMLVARTGRPARMESFEGASGSLAALLRDLGLRSGVGAPIRVEGSLWGVIVAASAQPEPFRAETESRLADFAELAATAIANTEARAALGRLAEEQAALRRVATLVARGVPPAEVFSAVADEAGRLLGADVTTMARFDPDGMATVVARRGEESAELPVGARWKPESPLATAAVLRTGRPARVDDYGTAPGRVVDSLRREGIRCSVASPIVVEGHLWGALIASSKHEPLPPDTEERMLDFTELAATAIANAESRAELTASRARIVAAADETRRRLERDLHDGAQQRLVSLALAVRNAEATVPPELSELRAQLAQVGEWLKGVLDELQEISRGIHPAILSEGGLAPALKTLARRSPVPVELNVRADTRLPEAVEVAAYYVVSEALTNAAKHAAASVAHVDVEARDGVLELAIRDDGAGGADPARGSGLIGLADRVQALGGTIDVVSPLGEGTSLHVTLPIGAD